MRVPAVRLGGLLAFTMLAVVALPGVLGGRDPRASEVAFVAPTSPQVEHPAANDYVNPLAHAHVTPERIDMGVDYAGTGNLTAIGWARITAVKTRNTGWPGAFIEYRLLHGSRAGRYVYYAEGVKPAREIHRGRLVRPGRVLAHLIPGWSTGIEIGWGAGIGTETLAERFHQSTYPTRCGRNFSAFIKSLGGPPGIP